MNSKDRKTALYLKPKKAAVEAESWAFGSPNGVPTMDESLQRELQRMIDETGQKEVEIDALICSMQELAWKHGWTSIGRIEPGSESTPRSQSIN